MEKGMPNKQTDSEKKGKGTQDQIANIRWKEQKNVIYGLQQRQYVEFVKLMDVLKHLIILSRILYNGQEAIVKTEFGETDRFRIEHRVKQR